MLTRLHSTRLVVLLAALAATQLAHGEEPLRSRLESLAQAHRGKVAVAVKHLPSGRSASILADEPMPTASLIKFPVMVEAYRQAREQGLDLAQTITLRDADKVPGSGILTTRFSEGATFSLRDAIRLMIADSDNTATNLVLDRVGLRSVNDAMDGLGLPNTRIHGKLYRREASILPERSGKFGVGSTTAAEMIRLLETLDRRELVNPASSDAMREHLRNCADAAMLPRFLPHGTVVAQKTGAIGDIRTAAGIIESPAGPIAICVLTAENTDRRTTDANAAERLIAEVAREAYNTFQSEAGPADPAAADLAEGDSGPAVEALQRTLNARLEPSPSLGVDGEFGPATRSAVLRFQRDRKLPETGLADSATRAALGPAPGEPLIPPPSEVNGKAEPRKPADPIDGPPFVTAKAWAALDAATGKLLGGQQADTPLDMASTTKMMTALVVARLAAADPKALDEVVTFTERADATSGSTSGVKAGERLPVRELLYGLLLPSGNDASVALGEHFGHRCRPPADRPDEVDPLVKFVAEMNRAAVELGLDASTFANTHGLTAPGHKSSPHDLARLAAATLADPLLAQVVATRRRGCTLVDAQGRTRNVLWVNTNRLLETDGYDGVKTGTTNAAGNCLVASGLRDGRRVIVVILGAPTTEGRYADARNLFRWAWSTPKPAP